MCTVIFAYKMHPNYDFIYLGNRDEFKYRKTLNAKFIGDILMGVDKEKGGTWLGINKLGKFSFITNYRDFSLIKDLKSSRGNLVKSFLESDISCEKYLEILKNKSEVYNPYNIIVGDLNELRYYTNVDNKSEVLKSGLYGLSNGFLNDKWFKVEKAKVKLSSLLSNQIIEPDSLFEILDDDEIPDDFNLPNTGIEIELERKLSSIHIDFNDYGTVYKTVILIDKFGNVKFLEKSIEDNFEKVNVHEFQIEKNIEPFKLE